MTEAELPKRSGLPSRQTVSTELESASTETLPEKDTMRMQAALDGLSNLALSDSIVQEPEQPASYNAPSTSKA